MIDKILGLVLILILMASCNSSEYKGSIITPDAPPKEELISIVLTSNDIDAYNSLLFYYPDDLAILPMAVYMAEKQGYGKAYSDLFHTLYSVFNDNSVSIDSITQKHMMYYLRRGIELKDTDCVWIMSGLYMTGTFVERDTIKAKENLMKIFSLKDINRFYWPLLKNEAELKLGK